MPQGPFNTLVAKIIGQTSYAALSLGKQSDQLVSELHGAKYSQAYQDNLFWGANQTGATISNGLATTYTGLCLSNPAGSGKNLSIRKITGEFSVVATGFASLGLITGYAAGGITVHGTALTPAQSKIGGAVVPVAKIDAACTLVGTPTWTRVLGNSKATTETIYFSEDLDGGIILVPGAYAAIGSLIAAGPTTGFYGSFEWEEVSP